MYRKVGALEQVFYMLRAAFWYYRRRTTNGGNTAEIRKDRGKENEFQSDKHTAGSIRGKMPG